MLRPVNAAAPEYTSPLSTRYATQAMVANFDDRRRYELWRALWIALATAQRDLGLAITDEQIAARPSSRRRRGTTSWPTCITSESWSDLAPRRSSTSGRRAASSPTTPS
jgi:hypothetical protein